MIDQVARMLRNRVANMIARAVVKLVDDSKAVQELQVSILDGETRDEVERVQNYGFTSRPRPGAEAVVVCVDGKRDHAIAVAVDDRRYRIQNLESGEVAVYDWTGSSIVFRASGDIELTPSSGIVTLAGDLNVSGTVTATTDVVGGSKSLKNHTHPVSLTGGTTASSCAAGGAAGTTSGNLTSGAPS